MKLSNYKDVADILDNIENIVTKLEQYNHRDNFESHTLRQRLVILKSRVSVIVDEIQLELIRHYEANPWLKNRKNKQIA